MTCLQLFIGDPSYVVTRRYRHIYNLHLKYISCSSDGCRIRLKAKRMPSQSEYRLSKVALGIVLKKLTYLIL